MHALDGPKGQVIIIKPCGILWSKNKISTQRNFATTNFFANPINFLVAVYSRLLLNKSKENQTDEEKRRVAIIIFIIYLIA